nr:hypothetical protein [Tanacetum cinerariifolium]
IEHHGLVARSMKIKNSNVFTWRLAQFKALATLVVPPVMGIDVTILLEFPINSLHFMPLSRHVVENFYISKKIPSQYRYQIYDSGSSVLPLLTSITSTLGLDAF